MQGFSSWSLSLREKQKHSAQSLCIISKAFYSFSLTYSHSILLNLNVNRFLGHFRKWGLCARTCIGLQRGFLTESELQGDATRAARKFARDPAAITIEAPSQDAFDASDVLFTIRPNDGRSTHNLRVSTPYHCGLVLEDVAATRS